jgi:hypothetical protein
MDTTNPDRPNIQINDLVRPMTDEEYAEWLAQPKAKMLGEQE